MSSASRLQPAVVAVLAAVLLLAGLTAIWVGRKAEKVADLVRPEMTDDGLAQHRHDFEVARATLEGFEVEVLPALAAALGVSPSALQSEIAATYAGIGKLLAQKDEIVPFAESSLRNLERQQSNFEDADDVPAPGAPAWAGGVVSVLLAVSLGGAAILLRRDERRTAAVVVAVAAALLVVVPLSLRIPQKSANAQEVLDSLNPSEAVVQRTVDSLETTVAGEAELREELLPALATALGVSEANLLSAIGRDFPGVGAGLSEMPDILERYEARLAIREGGAADLRTLKEVPFSALGWFDPAFGLVLGGVAVWLWLSRPHNGNSAPDRTSAT